MNLREVEISRIVRYLSDQTGGFADPKLVLIGGYALGRLLLFRGIHEIVTLFFKERKVGIWIDFKSCCTDTCEKRDVYGFMRCVKVLCDGAKISIDFMEGQVRGRTDAQAFFVSDEFLSKAQKVKIAIAKEVFEMYVPDYTDYFILKLMSARPSDVRDITTLVWKKGIPENLRAQAKKMLAYPEVIDKNLPLIISDVADKRFLDSWKGTFVTRVY